MAKVKHRTDPPRGRMPMYLIWQAMLNRCRNPNQQDYALYGGRGITVCARWRRYEHFLADMGPKPPGMTLDRINNTLGYTPENCRWATPTEQARNTRRNRWLTYRGETRCLSEWAVQLNMSYRTLHTRLHRGWPIAKALSLPRQSPGSPGRMFTYRGQTRSLTDWAINLKVPRDTLVARFRYGWTVAKALSIPVATRQTTTPK